MACNRADTNTIRAYLLATKNENCVFISHKKEDEAAAKAIGDFLLNTVGVDIYLDLHDIQLKEAVSTENDKKIVDSIRRGLNYCSHLLCIVSDKTHLSWWVPYEVGIASQLQKGIATLKLKGTEDIPSFLKTERVLNNMQDFLNYTRELIPLSMVFATRQTISKEEHELLGKFIE